MTTDNFCFYLQNRLIQTSQTGGQWFSDTSPFSIHCSNIRLERPARDKHSSLLRTFINYGCKKSFCNLDTWVNACLSTDEHPGLLRQGFNERVKCFIVQAKRATNYVTGSRGQSYKTFYGRNLRIFVI